ncbi:intermembrane phospholipid transport protein YdbH family protein [Sphingomonas sp. CLY1604]|uniref:intermembrane phospholipid transport protein YdbH family protein n=1 Tax=Sphingomonas sp. CLY1604 TaxID=3457786 RepID=UPI003FD8668D
MNDTPRRPRLARRQWVGIAIGLILLLACIALWMARKPIAARVIDRELAKRGVAARYGIRDLGLGRQRLTDVVIGDPAHPDLVADWLEAETHVGLDGARLVGVRAGHVRVRGRVVDGRLSLGALDRLMPPPSGKPFALPALDLNVADGRMRLETPAGVVGVRLSGNGRLDDGFSGTLALAAERLAQDGCSLRGLGAAFHLDVARGAPTVRGPVRIAQANCGGASVQQARADLNLTLAPALDGWNGRARLATGVVAGSGARAAALAGTVAFDGTARSTSGTLDLAAARAAIAAGQAEALAIRGDYRIGEGQRFAGTVSGRGMRLAAARTLDAEAAGAGTPLAPLVTAATHAARRAAEHFDGEAKLAVQMAGGAGEARIAQVALASDSGARLRLSGGTGVTIDWPQARVRLDTALAMGGGGLPDARVTLAQSAAGAPIRGRGTVAPYAAGGATLALTPVEFTATPGGATRVTTRATLSGPLGDGRVDGLSLPLDLRWDGRRRVAINSSCGALGIRRLAVAGLVLDPLRTTLCPLSGAMVTFADGRATGGVRLPAVQLAGRLGQTPLTVAASGAQLRLADRGFVVDGVATRLGSAERVTRIDLGQLTGRLAGAAVAGTFTGGSGQIANVPLLLGAAAGDWSLRGGALHLTGAMTVSDAASAPRFNPMEARAVALDLADGAIHATGTLYEPTKSVKVADVTIAHALAAGSGTADIAVPGITFAKDFQPDLLTRLTYGVVADVRARVTGEGHIAWQPEGVTSTGTFATRDAALAAAFGPVSGITTTIRFTDLLSLASAPQQVATIKTVNPGIAVNDGTIVYQLLPDTRVQIDSGVWPFAGGKMTLLPTTLDFAQAGSRRMTFRLEGVQADRFLAQFDFKNLDATGVFDGELPMVFDIAGGRIENGSLTVRPGGGSIAYVGDLTQKDLGLWGNIAFQALKSLRYRNLTIAMNGPLSGEMVTQVRFAGVTQGQGAKSNFLVRRLQRLPFVFNVRIEAPFRGLLDSAQSFYDPRRLIQRNLPALLERQQQQQRQAVPATPPIQPPASGTVP